MIKVTKTKVFNTETATVVKKVTVGSFGDPAGFETTLYQTPEGDFFLYTFGGSESAYAEEKIVSYTKARAQEWLANN